MYFKKKRTREQMGEEAEINSESDSESNERLLQGLSF